MIPSVDAIPWAMGILFVSVSMSLCLSCPLALLVAPSAVPCELTDVLVPGCGPGQSLSGGV